MRGLVTNIQRCSLHDGEGIRTTVFLKGCTLKCFWCHNPENIDPKPQLQYFNNKCIGCGKCEQVCSSGAQIITGGIHLFHRELCISCGKCFEFCPTRALVSCGVQMTIEDIMAEVEKDRPFYESSGGGVTLSGGEPLFQTDFTTELLKELKKAAFHTALDTCGNLPWKNLKDVIPYVDLFLYDIKVWDPLKHKKATGATNHIILDNLLKLGNWGKEIWIRIPVIPQVNNNRQDMEAIASFLQGLKGVKKIELLPFHNLAAAKYESLGLANRSDKLMLIDAHEMEDYRSIFELKGFCVRRID